MEFQAAKNAQLTTSQGSVIINIGKKVKLKHAYCTSRAAALIPSLLVCGHQGNKNLKAALDAKVGRESTVNKDYFHYVRLSRIIVLNPIILFINWSFLFLHIYCSAADFEKLLEPYIFKLGNKGIHAYISVLLQSRLGKTRLYCGSFGNII